MHAGLKKGKKEDRCPMSDHFIRVFCIGEFCFRRVSINLSPYYIFLEDVLVKGKARNKQRKEIKLYVQMNRYMQLSRLSSDKMILGLRPSGSRNLSNLVSTANSLPLLPFHRPDTK